MLSTDVYNILLDDLLKGKIQPGVILNRRQVAQKLGVSVAPVLQAMVQLEHEGFLHTIPRKGTMVRTLSKEDIRGNLVLKEAIECAAAERCTGAVVRKHYDELLKMALRLDNEFADRNTIEAWKLDLDFHRELVALSGYEVLVTEFMRIAVPNLFYHVNLAIHTNNNESHVALLDAMCSDDRRFAVEVLKRHLRSGKIL